MEKVLSWTEIKEKFDSDDIAMILNECNNCGMIVNEKESTVGEVLQRFDGVVNIGRRMNKRGELEIEDSGGSCSECLYDAGISPRTGFLLRYSEEE